MPGESYAAATMANVHRKAAKHMARSLADQMIGRKVEGRYRAELNRLNNAVDVLDSADREHIADARHRWYSGLTPPAEPFVDYRDPATKPIRHGSVPKLPPGR